MCRGTCYFVSVEFFLVGYRWERGSKFNFYMIVEQRSVGWGGGRGSSDKKNQGKWAGNKKYVDLLKIPQTLSPSPTLQADK